MSTYFEKLKDPRWQKKRLQILERDEWFCNCCGDSEATLHVHHKVYQYGVDPWDYPDSTLVTVCETCHEWANDLRRDLAMETAEVGMLQAQEELLFLLSECRELPCNGDVLMFLSDCRKRLKDRIEGQLQSPTK